jgi:hypothetical protein
MPGTSRDDAARPLTRLQPTTADHNWPNPGRAGSAARLAHTHAGSSRGTSLSVEIARPVARVVRSDAHARTRSPRMRTPISLPGRVAGTWTPAWSGLVDQSRPSTTMRLWSPARTTTWTVDCQVGSASSTAASADPPNPATDRTPSSAPKGTGRGQTATWFCPGSCEGAGADRPNRSVPSFVP